MIVRMPDGFWAERVIVNRASTGRTWRCTVQGRRVEGSVNNPIRQRHWIPVAIARDEDEAAHWALYKSRKVRVYYQGQKLRVRWRTLKAAGMLSGDFVRATVAYLAARFGEGWLTRNEDAQLACERMIDEERERIVRAEQEAAEDEAADSAPEGVDANARFRAVVCDAPPVPEGVTAVNMNGPVDELHRAIAEAVGEAPQPVAGDDGWCYCSSCGDGDHPAAAVEWHDPEGPGFRSWRQTRNGAIVRDRVEPAAPEPVPDPLDSNNPCQCAECAWERERQRIAREAPEMPQAEADRLLRALLGSDATDDGLCYCGMCRCLGSSPLRWHYSSNPWRVTRVGAIVRRYEGRSYEAGVETA